MTSKIEVGDIIEWCDEQYEVIEVYIGGDTGRVKDMSGDIIRNFKFNYNGEKSKIIKKSNRNFVKGEK